MTDLKLEKLEAICDNAATAGYAEACLYSAAGNPDIAGAAYRESVKNLDEYKKKTEGI